MDVFSTIFIFVVLAMLVEFVVDVIKKIIPIKTLGQVEVPPLISVIIGILVAWLVKADIFVALGFQPQYEVASWVITGVIISAGSKTVHELVSKLRESRAGGGT